MQMASGHRYCSHSIVESVQLWHSCSEEYLEFMNCMVECLCSWEARFVVSLSKLIGSVTVNKSAFFILPLHNCQIYVINGHTRGRVARKLSFC